MMILSDSKQKHQETIFYLTDHDKLWQVDYIDFLIIE